MIVSVYFRIIVRIYAEDVYYRCDRSRFNCNDSVFPRLNNFIQIFEHFFVFKGCVLSYRDLISNSVIVVNSCNFFANYVFFNFLIVYADVCISNQLYDLLGDSCLGQKQLSRTFSLSPVVRRQYCEGLCRQDYHLVSASSTYVSCRLYIFIIFPNT